MTEQQFNILKEHKGIYDLFMEVQMVNSAHPSMGAIASVYKEISGENINMSCGDCVAYALTRIYNEYLRFEQTQLTQL